MPTQQFDNDSILNGTKCVFVIASHCPQKTTTFSICKAAEDIEGVKVFGAQLRGGLWRVQPYTAINRINLLAGNLQMEGKQVAVHDKNPFLRGDVEDDDPSTLLSIDDLPWSISPDAIDRHLRSMGLKLRTKVKYQCDRDPKDGGLTEWRTGKRQVWINLPDKPLPKYTRVGDTQARLYLFEIKAQEGQGQGMQCRKCLGFGHKASD